MTDDAHFRLRIPAELHSYLVEEAAKNRRSINAEIVARLQDSVTWAKISPTKMRDEILSLRREVTDLRFGLAQVRQHLRQINLFPYDDHPSYDEGDPHALDKD
jgi:hypothetical protein